MQSVFWNVAISGDGLGRARQFLVDAGVPPEHIRTAAVVSTQVARQNHKAPDHVWREVRDIKFSFPWGRAR